MEKAMMDFGVVTSPTSSETPENFDGDFYLLSMSSTLYTLDFR